jgi:exodeoxyribonuclease VII large subunit
MDITFNVMKQRLVVGFGAMNDGTSNPPGMLRVVQAPKPMSVSELNRVVKGAIEDRFGLLWVEGEITALKISAGTGHVYFDLKDEREEARIACVVWKGTAQKSRAKLQNGERVQLKGKPTLYPQRGQFQFVAELAVPAGAGAAAAALSALKERLQEEGLFAPERKRPLPRFPRTVGVVTSQSGAAFQDICRALHQRWPARIVLAPTLVQGADAPAQIVKAMAAIQRVRGLDVVIVGRGGGASEDLAAFNDERVVRAIASCRVAVVSAVGHEIDHTISDLVADRRASTPTMAAEFCTPVATEEHERLTNYRARVHRAMQLMHRGLLIALKRRALRDPRRSIADARMHLGELSRHIDDRVRDQIGTTRDTLTRMERTLVSSHPKARLDRDRAALQKFSARLKPALDKKNVLLSQRLRDVDARLHRAMTKIVDLRKQKLGTAAAKLDALSPVAILARGYSVVLLRERALTKASEVVLGDTITVRLHEGEIDARVEQKRP